MWISDKWQDYELIGASDGERLERWGKYITIRPDPQIIWKNQKKHPAWKKADAVYSRSSSGGGAWSEYRLPESWNISYNNLKFIIRPTGFKHTGLFPEQAVNWEWIISKIKNSGRNIKVLNLFAYTGAATIAAASAGASVCHIDAARAMVEQAKKNAELSGFLDAPVRWITEDCKKFVEREIKRGNKYDAIIMDPPSYGRGPSGEIWKLEDNIYDFAVLCSLVLSDSPLFVLINSYTTGLSPSVMSYILNVVIKPKFGGFVSSDELGLSVTETGCCIPCGSAARWESDK